MSRRPQILAGCLRLLACGPETTRDLSLHVGTSRALVAVALHGEPGVTREGDTWILSRTAIQAREARESKPAPVPHVYSAALVWLSQNAGFHTYATIADGSGVSYSAVAIALVRQKHLVHWSKDDRGRVTVKWKGATVLA